MAFAKTAVLKGFDRTFSVSPECKPYTLRDNGFSETKGGNFQYKRSLDTEHRNGLVLKVTVDKGNFDNTKAGTYIIKYVVEDSDKNVTVVERTVIVEEKRVDVIEDTTNNKPNKPNTHNSDKDTSKNEINKAINFIM